MYTRGFSNKISDTNSSVSQPWVIFILVFRKVKPARIGICSKNQPKLMHKLSVADKKTPHLKQTLVLLVDSIFAILGSYKIIFSWKQIKRKSKVFLRKVDIQETQQKGRSYSKRSQKSHNRGKRLDGKRKQSIEHVATFQTYLHLLACLRSELINKSAWCFLFIIDSEARTILNCQFPINC